MEWLKIIVLFLIYSRINSLKEHDEYDEISKSIKYNKSWWNEI